jgi:hypothetical protein
MWMFLKPMDIPPPLALSMDKARPWLTDMEPGLLASLEEGMQGGYLQKSEIPTHPKTVSTQDTNTKAAHIY